MQRAACPLHLRGRRSDAAHQQRAWLSRLPAADYANLFKESLGEATMVSMPEKRREAGLLVVVG